MGLESVLYLKLRNGYNKKDTYQPIDRTTQKNKKEEELSTKTKKMMKRNLSIENFMKFSWSWTL